MRFLISMTIFVLCLFSCSYIKAEEEKQPVFLFCPHKESVSSLSLYVMMDKADNKKLKGVGIEELTGQNSKDSSYADVQKAQRNVDIDKVPKGYLSIDDFKTGILSYNNILEISICEVNGEYKIILKAKVGFDEYFRVGGEACEKRDFKLCFSQIFRCWQTKAKTLFDSTGKNVVSKFNKVLTGIRFVASATRVSTIVAMDDDGGAIVIMDR